MPRRGRGRHYLGQPWHGLSGSTALSWLFSASVARTALARPHSRVSVNPDLMIVQDAFRTRLALHQRVVPFDVAGVRQLLAAAIR